MLQLPPEQLLVLLALPQVLPLGHEQLDGLEALQQLPLQLAPEHVEELLCVPQPEEQLRLCPPPYGL